MVPFRLSSVPFQLSRVPFLAPTGELYELLCHRKERKGRKSTNDPFLE